MEKLSLNVSSDELRRYFEHMPSEPTHGTVTLSAYGIPSPSYLFDPSQRCKELGVHPGLKVTFWYTPSIDQFLVKESAVYIHDESVVGDFFHVGKPHLLQFVLGTSVANKNGFQKFMGYYALLKSESYLLQSGELHFANNMSWEFSTTRKNSCVFRAKTGDDLSRLLGLWRTDRQK